MPLLPPVAKLLDVSNESYMKINVHNIYITKFILYSYNFPIFTLTYCLCPRINDSLEQKANKMRK